MSSSQRPAGRTPAVGDRLEIRIDKLAVGGAGLARSDGFVLFVPDSVPGDVLEVEVVEVRANHGTARLRRVLEPGRGRRSPPCRYAGECGGCNWQHIEEAVQHEQKQTIVEETLRKFLPGLEIPLDPFVPSPRALRYRNRVQPLRKDQRLGYRKRRSHDFLPVEDCLIVEEALSPFFRNPPPGRDDVRLELRLRPDGNADMSEAGDDEGFAFSQVNRFQNEQLVASVVESVKERDFSAIWDLYGGGGNFTFPLADAFPKTDILGVELNAALVRRARTQIESFGRKGFSFFVSDVEAWLRRKIPPSNSLVVLDPPRAGAGPFVMNALAASEARTVIYVACHPVALARDLATFLAPRENRRWKLTKVQAFEMFPQTDHVETVAQLEIDRP